MVHTGIVLRTYIPNKQKLAVLDSVGGRLECVPRKTNKGINLPHGALITFSARQWGKLYIASDIELIDLPYYWVKQDFLFLHHVLELCLYFLPLDSGCPEIFELVTLLYQIPSQLDNSTSKKLFLCTFFAHLGIYPAPVDDNLFLNLISAPINSKLNACIDAAMQDRLDRWIKACVNVHPYAHKLKTRRFLYSMDKHEK